MSNIKVGQSLKVIYEGRSEFTGQYKGSPELAGQI